jgi:hypothetical protein
MSASDLARQLAIDRVTLWRWEMRAALRQKQILAVERVAW